MKTVTVFHNVTPGERGTPTKGILDGYDHGDTVVPVFTTTAPHHDDMATLEAVFALLNIGHDPEFGPPDERAEAYRRARNRSLSVGDVVAVGARWYACAPTGWWQVNEPATVSYESVPGSTSMVTT